MLGTGRNCSKWTVLGTGHSGSKLVMLVVWSHFFLKKKFKKGMHVKRANRSCLAQHTTLGPRAVLGQGFGLNVSCLARPV